MTERTAAHLAVIEVREARLMNGPISIIRRSYRAFLFACVLIIAAACAKAADANPEAFEAANRLYLEGKYSEAATTYGILEQSGQRSAALYFNWGNALFKSGQLGRAIAAYHEAQAFAPRDPDIRANLQFARAQRQGPTLSPTKSQLWLRKMSVNEWAIVSALGIWVLFGLLTFSQFRPLLWRNLRPSVVILAVITVALCACTGAALSASKSGQQAVVTAADAMVRNGPLDEAQTTFTLHDGAEARVIDRKDDWFQIEVDGGRTGWIKRDQVALLR